MFRHRSPSLADTGLIAQSAFEAHESLVGHDNTSQTLRLSLAHFALALMKLPLCSSKCALTSYDFLLRYPNLSILHHLSAYPPGFEVSVGLAMGSYCFWLKRRKLMLFAQ